MIVLLAVHAVLIAAAIALWAVSVAQQRTRTRDGLRQQALQSHLDLLRQGIADPELARLWMTERLEGLSDGEIRAHLFLNARIIVLELEWETGALTPVHLRVAAESFLSTPQARQYWERARTVRARVAEQAAQRTFHTAFEDAYNRYGTPVAG
ncbi:DUF6082 family protein [Streptomyces sp. NPDC047072]|uniref:DUF6082 family protein n=1 Tax=Streptomyces sp. NPDC047072 TaxID=3154809 RepID=UPI0033EE149D